MLIFRLDLSNIEWNSVYPASYLICKKTLNILIIISLRVQGYHWTISIAYISVFHLIPTLTCEIKVFHKFNFQFQCWLRVIAKRTFIWKGHFISCWYWTPNTIICWCTKNRIEIFLKQTVLYYNQCYQSSLIKLVSMDGEATQRGHTKGRSKVEERKSGEFSCAKFGAGKTVDEGGWRCYGKISLEQRLDALVVFS